jgi:NAD(P)-dependent dehydrogenase (short-subunit alcohol dehydrogenase family)
VVPDRFEAAHWSALESALWRKRMQELAGRVAVVTGAASGIGRALVQQLTAAGCHVALCDLSEPDMAETMRLCQPALDTGVRVTAHHCDVSNEADLIAFQQQVVKEHSTEHINLLFNNAGVSGGQSFVRDAREHWDRVFAICWGGVYLGCRVFMPMLQASEEAHIVNTSSVNGFWACLGGDIEHTAYSAAKFAVKGFSEALVIDLRKNAPHIKVSVVMPGHIGTAIALNSHKMWLGEPADMDAKQLAQLRDRWASFNPDAAQLTDDMVRDLALTSAESFRDNAPTSANQAAQIILAGVQKEQWRILVGDDAALLDQAVRDNPAGAYDEGFFDFVSPVTR